MRKRRTFCQRMQYASSTTDPLRKPGRGGVLHHTGRRRGGNGGSRVPGAPNVRKGEGNPTTHAMNVPVPPAAAGTSQLGQPRYQNRPPAYCFNCGNPDHYANVCPFGRQGQGAPLILPCQNCKEYGHAAPFCPKPQQPRVVYKQVEVPPRE